MPKAVIEIEDVGGSFARFLKQAPKVARARLGAAVKKTVVRVADKMHANAPVGPDAPHIRDEITTVGRGLTYRAGIFDNDEQAHIALYNEYRPNRQPFMLPAAISEENPFVAACKDALRQVESDLENG